MSTGRALRSLKFQKRMAMSILGVGRSKTWLDPSQIPVIAQARTRADIRSLISRGLIKEKIKTHKNRWNVEKKLKARRAARRGLGTLQETVEEVVKEVKQAEVVL